MEGNPARRTTLWTKTRTATSCASERKISIYQPWRTKSSQICMGWLEVMMEGFSEDDVERHYNLIVRTANKWQNNTWQCFLVFFYCILWLTIGETEQTDWTDKLNRQQIEQWLCICLHCTAVLSPSLVAGWHYSMEDVLYIADNTFLIGEVISSTHNASGPAAEDDAKRVLLWGALKGYTLHHPHM